MEHTTPASPEIPAPPSGPGRLLHQARKDLRLAPEDVAQILHLSRKQIVALEQDDYKNLPGPTYVRGYLRSYAQLLGLSPEKVLESYNNLTVPSKPISLPQSAPPPQITSSDYLIKAATVGVAAIVLGLVYLWWRSEEKPPEQTSSPPAAVISQAPTAEPDNSTGSPAHPSVSSGSNSITPTENPPPPAAVEPAPRTPSSAPRTPPIAAPATPPTPMKPGSTNGQVTVSGMILNVSPDESPKPATAPAQGDRALARSRQSAAVPPGVPRSRLVLHATQESWADVRDARDNKLLYENVPAGRSITIEGVAPFSVFLGNADGVKVEFNGQNYDVSRHKRGQVARFTLGETAAVNN